MKSDQEKAEAIEERLIDFGVRIIKLSSQLPKNLAGRHVAGQVLRAGTSPAPNYAEARSAGNRADFIHKSGIALKELNETLIWLKMILRGELIKAARLTEIIKENSELARIVSSSIKAAARQTRNSKSVIETD